MSSSQILISLAPVGATAVGSLLWMVISGKWVSATKVLAAKTEAKEALQELKTEHLRAIRDAEKRHDREIAELNRDLDRARHENEKLTDAARQNFETMRTYQLAIRQNSTVAETAAAVLSALQQPGLLGPKKPREPDV